MQAKKGQPSEAGSIDLLLRAGKFPEAIERARWQFKLQPTKAIETIYRTTLMAACEHYTRQNALRDANVFLAEAESLGSDDPQWWARLALMRCELGDPGAANKLAERSGDPSLKQRLLEKQADRAVREGPAARPYLTPELQVGYDCVVKAFAEYEKGRDDEARATLNAIGLQSPFLDWKLLIRGLIAWAANDVPKAIENWSRLKADRLPAQIAAPFRFGVDRSFASTIPADRGPEVARQVEVLGMSGGLADGLRRLRRFLADERGFDRAMTTAKAIMPELIKLGPTAKSRLADIAYWALIEIGEAADMDRYLKVFGPHPDDKEFLRLRAMVFEAMDKPREAHQSWNMYQQWLERSLERWPGDLGKRAQALIFHRMGELAVQLEEFSDLPELADLLDFFQRPGKKTPKAPPVSVKPTAKECFARAVELAPDWTVPALELLAEAEDDPAESARIADRLIKQFPNNIEVIEAATKAFELAEDHEKARKCVRTALQINPLDRRLRSRVAILSLEEARALALKKNGERAEAALKEATELGDPAVLRVVESIRAAMQIQRGESEKGAALASAIEQSPDQRLAAPYRLFVELSRLKLKKKDLDPYLVRFQQVLSSPSTIGEKRAILDSLHVYLRDAVPYRGLKTQQKMIIAELTKSVDGPQEELIQLGLALHRLGEWKSLEEMSMRAQRLHEWSPHLAFFTLDSQIARRPRMRINYRIGQQMKRIIDAINECKDGSCRELQALVDARLEAKPDLKPWIELRDYW